MFLAIRCRRDVVVSGVDNEDAVDAAGIGVCARVLLTRDCDAFGGDLAFDGDLFAEACRACANDVVSGIVVIVVVFFLFAFFFFSLLCLVCTPLTFIVAVL